MYLLQKTCWNTNALKFSCDFFSGNSTCVPSNSGRPTEGGVSGSRNQSKTATIIAIAAGTMKHRRQSAAKSIPLTRNPQSRTTPILPTLCEMFQIENFVASCRGGNQLAISRAQGGKPM